MAITGQVRQGNDYAAGIVLSTNGGSSWTQVRISSQANSETTVAAISPGNGNVLYAGGRTYTNEALVFRSVNGGASWTDITHGIERVPSAIAVDPQDPDTVYVGTYWDAWRSANGGASWTKCAFPGYSYNISSIHPNRSNANEVFVGTGRGVYYSKDRGLTWTDLSEGLDVQYINQVYFDPATRTLYAATDGGGVWKKKL